MTDLKMTVSISGMSRVNVFAKLVNRKIVLLPLVILFGVEQTANLLPRICERLIKFEVV